MTTDIARLREILARIKRRAMANTGDAIEAGSWLLAHGEELLNEIELLRETTAQQAHHQRVVDAAAAAIAEERDRYRDDADRYRWLQSWELEFEKIWTDWRKSDRDIYALDAAIDAAKGGK